MYLISKEFHFSASHQLKGLRADHQCARLHGHNYVVEFVLMDHELNEVGFVQDYETLDDVKKWIDNNWDHRHLNDHYAFDTTARNPSAENMAKFLFDLFQASYRRLYAIRVRETPKTCAEYRPR